MLSSYNNLHCHYWPMNAVGIELDIEFAERAIPGANAKAS